MNFWKQFSAAIFFLVLSNYTNAATFNGIETVHQGGDPERVIDIVYVSVGFDNSSDSRDQYDVAVSNSIGFMTFSPFAQYESYFNIHKLYFDSTLTEEYGGLKNIAKQYVSDVDFWVFLRNETGRSIAVNSIIDSDPTINLFLPASPGVIAHELGHVLGSLSDEYLESAKCPEGVYTGTESSLQLNLTTDPDLSTLKWKH